MVCSICKFKIETDTINNILDYVLPIDPHLRKGDNNSLHLIWENPYNTSDYPATYDFEIKINVTDGYQSNQSYHLRASQPQANITLNLTGLECKHVEVAISLPGNCTEKTVSGALLISEWYNEYWVVCDMYIFCGCEKLLKSSRRISQVSPSFLLNNNGRVSSFLSL